MDVLVRIKRLVLHGSIRFTLKARIEMRVDALSYDDIVESLLNASRFDKVLRSKSQHRHYAGEKLYVIKSANFTGTFIQTKGKIVRQDGREYYYLLISSKISTHGD